MKNILSTLICLFAATSTLIAQEIGELEFVSPVKNGMIAIEKNGQWAFMNEEGDMIIDFSDDLVRIKRDGHDYPYFENDRCLISQKKEGINYYGFIDRSGKTVIEPQFLNATAFNGDRAIALELMKDEVGKNDLLDKNVVYYKYFEVVIDLEGQVLTYLTDPVYIVLDKEELVVAPKIKSKFISEKLVAVRNKNKTWTVKKID